MRKKVTRSSIQVLKERRHGLNELRGCLITCLDCLLLKLQTTQTEKSTNKIMCKPGKYYSNQLLHSIDLLKSHMMPHQKACLKQGCCLIIIKCLICTKP